jgi:hypothetical protein
MKLALIETAEKVCHIRRGPPIHKVTWWWSEEVASAVIYKKAC